LCHPSGFGEGRFYLGLFPIQTDGAGFFAGIATFNTYDSVNMMPILTATGNARNGNSSQFSACFTFTPRPPAPPLPGLRPPIAPMFRVENGAPTRPAPISTKRGEPDVRPVSNETNADGSIEDSKHGHQPAQTGFHSRIEHLDGSFAHDALSPLAVDRALALSVFA
jgi:hypothetical protein